MQDKKRKKLKGGEKLEDRIAPSIIGGIAGIDEIPEEIVRHEKAETAEVEAPTNEVPEPPDGLPS